MIAINTIHHITCSNLNEAPYKACKGKCKKVWWKQDLLNRSSKFCPLCNGKLRPAVEGDHFTILSNRLGPLTLEDLNQYEIEVGTQELDERQLKMINVNHISMVKIRFVEKAKKNWC